MEKGELLDFSVQMKGALSADFRETHKGLTKLLPDTIAKIANKYRNIGLRIYVHL
jgi:hypothetical protein